MFDKSESRMYHYRHLTPEQKRAIVAQRKERGFPWHAPPHPDASGEYRIVTAACFEHQPILNSDDRLNWFSNELQTTLKTLGTPCAAWCVLPNHYHVLVRIIDIREFTEGLGKLHGRTSYEMNREDTARGRQVWYRCADRCMRSERHFYASVNYIHNNPVKHGYVSRWQDWPYSSVHGYFEARGRDWMLDTWREYPILDYGDGWDEM
jgi:putative transposase